MGIKSEIVAIVAGSAGVYFAFSIADKRARQTSLIASAALLGYGLYKFSRNSGAQAQKEAIAHELSLPPGTSLADEAIAAYGNLTGEEPAPNISTQTDRPADKGPYLPTPKNVLRVSGVIRYPQNGGTVRRHLFGDTIVLDAAIENQDTVSHTGLVQARYQKGGDFVYQDGPRVTLAPGAFQTVTLRIPAVDNVALRFANYTLDQVSYDVTGAFGILN